MYQFIKPFLHNEMSIFEEHGAFHIKAFLICAWFPETYILIKSTKMKYIPIIKTTTFTVNTETDNADGDQTQQIVSNQGLQCLPFIQHQ